MIAFTGSFATGREIARLAAEQVDEARAQGARILADGGDRPSSSAASSTSRQC
ncbi:MAG: hypothetical protein ABI901_07025 [Roseiflexaceae bacterium]